MASTNPMNSLDKVVAFFAPEAALKRIEAREAIALKYAAAQNAHWLGPFSPQNNSANNEIGSSWNVITARSRQLTRDFPCFHAAVNSAAAFVVGDGIRFQSLVRKKDGTHDKEMAQLIEDKFAEWCEGDCDQTGTMNFQEMQALAVRSEMETGDYLFMENYDGRSKQHSFRAIDPVNLTEGALQIEDPKSSVWFGIEYDRTTLQRKAYHLGQQDDFGSNPFLLTPPVRIPAHRMIHGYNVRSPDQLRGVSPFASAILLARTMQDYMQAELTTQQAHSKWIAFVTSKGTGTGASWDKAEWNDTRKKWEERLDFATMELLKPGQEVTLNSVQRSPDSVTKFTAQILRMVAASTGLPYEIISKDYQGLNYSVSRQVRNDFKQELKPKWATIIAHLCRPIFERWLDKAVLRGDLKIPDYFERRRDYQRGLWIPPGLEAVDPVKDVQAAKEMIAAGLSDPQSFIMGRGKDPEHVMANLKKWKADLEAGGLSEVWDLQFAAMTAPLVDDNANNSQNNADQGDE